MPQAAPVALTDDDRAELARWSKGGVAKITLAAPHGWEASGLASGQVLGIPPCSSTTSSTVAATIRPPW
jgi:hypothetical protein